MDRYENLIDKNIIENYAFDLVESKLIHLVSKGIIEDFEYNKEDWYEEGHDISFVQVFDITLNIGEFESISFDYDVIGDVFTFYNERGVPVEVFEIRSPIKVNWL